MARVTKWAADNAQFILDNSDIVVSKKLGKTIASVQRRRRELRQNLLAGQVKSEVSQKPLSSIPIVSHKKPKILIYDIETSYLVAKTWGLWQTDVIGDYEGIIEDWQILTVGWSWFGNPKVYVKGQDDFDDFVPGKLNDRNLVQFIADLYNEADIVIAHNGRSFDQKKCRARMVIHKIVPPKYPKEIDTKLVAKQVGGFTANSLKALCKMLDLPFQKLDSGGISTWDGCREGDMKAWAQMKKYNKGDIPTLAALYERLRPYMTNHPNLAQMFGEFDACPICLSKDTLVHRDFYYTKTNTYYLYQCSNCSSWSRERNPVKLKEKVTYVQ